LPVVRKGW
jgi:hypothetical protein